MDLVTTINDISGELSTIGVHVGSVLVELSQYLIEQTGCTPIEALQLISDACEASIEFRGKS